MSIRAAAIFAVAVIAAITLFFTAAGSVILAGAAVIINGTGTSIAFRAALFFASIGVLFVCAFLMAYALPRLMDKGIEWDLDDRGRK